MHPAALGKRAVQMVFRKKLPGTAVHPRRSAQDLAGELEVELSVVTDALKAIGEWVGSPRKKTIEEPVVNSVYFTAGPELHTGASQACFAMAIP